MKRGKKRRSHAVTEVRNFTFSLQRILLYPPPVVRRLFDVNSEPHTGARPSVRLCVGLIKKPAEVYRADSTQVAYIFASSRSTSISTPVA